MASKTALIVVDMQNDFCPPNGSLAVAGGREIIPLVNNLLNSSVFALKVATQDYHPQNHVSFASNHPAPNNQPFESFVKLRNHATGKPDETLQLRLWPDHCVQGTAGADLVDDLDADKVDIIVRKGMDPRVEMYSAFHDAFGNLTAGAGGVSHDLAQVLSDHDISIVYVVGLAGDYCVKDTAVGAAKAGFSTYLLEECQRCVDSENWPNVTKELQEAGVTLVDLKSKQVQALGISA